MVIGRLGAVSWTGLDSFMQELQVLAADLTAEANAIMIASAEEARTAIAAAYPYHTGALRAGLVLRPARGTLIAGAALVQTAPHGWIYEKGTQARTNRAGANRGRMPARPTFDPIANAHLRAAIDAVVDLLYAHGAVRVTREAA
ncbi:MAG TPA: hypothetical protein VN903_15840 [Polyangia bacterium]|nr:hypothetical protein [Polyangia bacterium]